MGRANSKDSYRRYWLNNHCMEALKKWVLSWHFVQDEAENMFRAWKDSERVNIFAAAQKDILETMRDDIENKVKSRLDEKLKEMLSLSKMPDIIKMKGNQVLINGEPIDESRLSNLRSEAEIFASADLWKVLVDSVSEKAKETMFTLGEDSQKQLDTGRTILYTLSSQKNAIETLRKLSTTTS